MFEIEQFNIKQFNIKQFTGKIGTELSQEKVQEDKVKGKETVGFMIKTLSGMLLRCQMNFLKETGHEKLPHMHGWVIGFLYDNQDKEICQRDLEVEFSIARSTVTSIVKQMEKNGYITRVGVDRDSRLKQLKLTKKGEECHQTVIKNIRQIEEMICQDIEPEQLEIFLEVARQIRRNLIKNQGDAECCSCMSADSVEL